MLFVPTPTDLVRELLRRSACRAKLERANSSLYEHAAIAGESIAGLGDLVELGAPRLVRGKCSAAMARAIPSVCTKREAS